MQCEKSRAPRGIKINKQIVFTTFCWNQMFFVVTLQIENGKLDKSDFKFRVLKMTD